MQGGAVGTEAIVVLNRLTIEAGLIAPSSEIGPFSVFAEGVRDGDNNNLPDVFEIVAPLADSVAFNERAEWMVAHLPHTTWPGMSPADVVANKDEIVAEERKREFYRFRAAFFESCGHALYKLYAEHWK